MNLGKSENNLIQVQKWRAVDKRVSSSPASPAPAIPADRQIFATSLVQWRIDRFDLVRCVASVALINCRKTARTEREELP